MLGLDGGRQLDDEAGAHGVSMRVGALALIGVVAFAARLHAMLRGGGLGGISNYDDGVYFAGAESLVSGRLPYRDFVLLHPPGIVVVLSPFAALAHLLSDATAFELGRLVFIALGPRTPFWRQRSGCGRASLRVSWPVSSTRCGHRPSTRR